MNRNGTIAIIVVIILIAGVAYWYSTQYPANPAGLTTGQQNTVLFPAGGETLIEGQTYTLSWRESDTSSTSTQIFLVDTSLESQGASVSITDRIYGLADTGSYQYTVPTNIPTGTYKLEIGTLTSNDFLIATSS